MLTDTSLRTASKCEGRLDAWAGNLVSTTGGHDSFSSVVDCWEHSASAIGGWMGMENWRYGSDRGKPVPVPLCPPQIPHGLAWARTTASEVWSRRLTARRTDRLWNPPTFRYQTYQRQNLGGKTRPKSEAGHSSHLLPTLTNVWFFTAVGPPDPWITTPCSFAMPGTDCPVSQLHIAAKRSSLICISVVPCLTQQRAFKIAS